MVDQKALSTRGTPRATVAQQESAEMYRNKKRRAREARRAWRSAAFHSVQADAGMRNECALASVSLWLRDIGQLPSGAYMVHGSIEADYGTETLKLNMKLWHFKRAVKWSERGMKWNPQCFKWRAS